MRATKNLNSTLQSLDRAHQHLAEIKIKKIKKINRNMKGSPVFVKYADTYLSINCPPIIFNTNF